MKPLTITPGEYRGRSGKTMRVLDIFDLPESGPQVHFWCTGDGWHAMNGDGQYAPLSQFARWAKERIGD